MVGMKKAISIALFASMIISLYALALPVAGIAGMDPIPVDITDQIKWSTVCDVYSMKLPVVRLDAVFVHAQDYDPALSVQKAPGSGNRTVIFKDWTYPYFFDDPFNLGDGVFYYNNVQWQNPVNKEDVNDHGMLVYEIEVSEAGRYEFVVLGCAQITDANLDNDAKDRGFCYSVDGGPMYQVNISDTLGVFREYKYEYLTTELKESEIKTTNGVNSYYYQPVYYYNMFADLTAGKHTFEFHALAYSGESFTPANSSRLNFMGFYYQKAISEAEWLAYTYPEVTTPAETETSKAPETETSKPTDTDTTTVKGDEDTKESSETTPTPTETTKEEAKEKGCKSAVGFGVLAFIIPTAMVLKKKKH
jgi:hypothetical protein